MTQGFGAFDAPPQQPQYGPPPQQYGTPAGFQQPQYQQYGPPAGFQQYGPPQGQQVVETGTFEDYWDQKSTGEGQSLKFTKVGDTYTFRQTRDLVRSDVQQQIDPQGRPMVFRDGSKKWVLVIPGELSDGTPVTWWCKGQARTKLREAWTDAGIVGEAPKGTLYRVTMVGERPSGNGFQPAKLYDVKCKAPDGYQPQQKAAPQPSSAQQPIVQTAPPQQQPPVPPQQTHPVPFTQTAPPPQQQPPAEDLFAKMLEE